MGQDPGYHHRDKVSTPVSGRFTQISESLRSAPLRPIAVLNLGPDDFSERYGLTFLPDSRGTSVAALLQTRSGQQYMLLRHHDDPGAGIEVLARESGPSELDLREFLAAFDLDHGVVSWALAQENGASSASEQHAPATLRVGESLVGEGDEVAHVDVLIGSKDGPVGKAFAEALINQREGHTNLLAVVAPNLPAKPDTLIANKVTIKGPRRPCRCSDRRKQRWRARSSTPSATASSRGTRSTIYP
jgi:hypothetical protein